MYVLETSSNREEKSSHSLLKDSQESRKKWSVFVINLPLSSSLKNVMQCNSKVGILSSNSP
jgi:hypothetical protein